MPVEQSVRKMHMLASGFQFIARLNRDTSAALTGCLVYLIVSIYSGSIFRNSFDDEIYTLLKIQKHSFVEILNFATARIDVHPPLPNLVFKALWTAWPSIYFLRCFSLICSMICIYLGIRLVLGAFQSATQTKTPWKICAVVFIIATTPLVVSQGDSVRWYPMFAALVFIAFSYESVGKPWHSAFVAGIGFSTDLLGAPVYAGMAACRVWAHLRSRPMSAKVIADEFGYALYFLATGILGVTTLLVRLIWHPAMLSEQLGSTIVAIGQAPLGMIGGYSLGLFAGLPIVAVYSALLIYALWRQRRHLAKIKFVLLASLTPALIILIGFSKSRSFLFLAVAFSLVLAASVLTATTRRALAITGAAILIHMIVVANRGGTVGIFKRNLAIPFTNISEFVKLNMPADGALMTTDGVVAYMANEQGTVACVALSARAPCLRDRHSAIVTLTGEPDLRRQTQILEFARARCRREEAAIPFGIDEEAALKSKLSGSELSRVILMGRLFKDCN